MLIKNLSIKVVLQQLSLSQLMDIFKIKSFDATTNADGLAPLGLPFSTTTIISAWHSAHSDGNYIILEPYHYQISDNSWGVRCTYEDGSLVKSKTISIGCMYIDK